MNFLRRLFGGASQPSDPAFHLYVRCNRCGSLVRVRVHLHNDLTVDYENEVVSGYQLHKEIMDSKCFRLMRADIRFDRNRRELERSIEGGVFVTQEDYEAALQQA